MKWLKRAGGIMVSPRATLRNIALGPEGGVGDILVLMFGVLLGTAPADLAQVAWGLGRGFAPFFSKLVSLYVQFSFWPLLGCLLIAMPMLLYRHLKQHKIPIEGIIAASFYLWVPVGLLGLLGSMMRVFGLDCWMLPYQPLSLFLEFNPTVGMVVLRCVVSYGWSLWLAWHLFAVIREESSPGKSPFPMSGGWVLGGFLVLSYACGAVFISQHLDEIRPIQVGEQIRDFELPRVDGGAIVSTKDLRGKPVVLEFWATWCPTCISLMPELEQWSQRHPEVTVVSVHQGGELEEIRGVLSGSKTSKTIFLWDAAGAASQALRVDTLPAFFAIDGAGRIVDFLVGAPPSQWLDQTTKLAAGGGG